VRITLLAALLLALAGCGGKSASNEAFDEAVTVAENSTVALGKADCSNLLVKGEVSDGWAEPPPVSSLPPDKGQPRTYSPLLERTQKASPRTREPDTWPAAVMRSHKPETGERAATRPRA
jgi:hypothetical protein